METVALLTGRGNNTLKDKNILEVCGKPLLAYPAEAARRSEKIDEFFVSSDDEKILSIAHERGYRKIKRPPELARPDARHVDAILHSLDVMKEEGVEPDILIVLLANTVCVKTEWIDQCVQQIMDDPGISAVVPVVSDLDHHPYRAKRPGEGGFLESFFDFSEREISSNRQELGDCFFLCHNFWVLNVKESVYSKKGQPPWKFMGDRVKPFEVEWSIDVHTEEDLLKSEQWVKANL
ncbi:MAG: NTP transferase domain-containing protein [Nitrospinae bacterium]|nr:NTP transferase domain-containing protein [Nitrospinota bacterium]